MLRKTEKNMARYTFNQYEVYKQFKSNVQVGDIIISQTNDILYDIGRKVLKVTYDHLSVLIDQDVIIHISWPQIRIIHPLQLISKSSQIKVVRPKFVDKETEIFIKHLSASLDQQYDYLQFYKGVWRKLFSQLRNHEEFLKKTGIDEWVSTSDIVLQRKKVCTDLVFFALMAASTEFRQFLMAHISKLDFKFIGSFTPDDLKKLVNIGDYFKMVVDLKIQTNQKISQLVKEKYKLGKKYLEFDIQNILSAPKNLLDVINSVETIITMFNLIQIIQMPPKQRKKKIISMFISRFSNKELNKEKTQKLANRTYHILEILQLYQKGNTIYIGFQMVYHILMIFFPNDNELLMRLLKWRSKF